MKGFILTRQWRDTRKGIELEIWLASDEGPIRLLVPHQSAVCFFRESDLPVIQPLLSLFSTFDCKPVALKNFYGDRVMALYSPQQRQLREFQQLCEQHKVTLWEHDIKPHDRFLMERFITASLDVDTSGDSSAYQFRTVTSQKIKAVDYHASLNVIALDIETSMDASQLYSIAVYSEQDAIVFMVDKDVNENTSEQTPQGFTLNRYPHARLCLHYFLRWLQEYDPDIIIGWHVVQFDLWVLEKISRELKVPFVLGRAKQRVNWREDVDPVSGKVERRYAYVAGRIVLDGIELLKTAFYQFERFSLQAVASELLGESKLIEEDDRGYAITQLFHQDKPALAAYNLQDCKLTWAIFEKTKLLDFAIERTRLTGLPLDRVGGSVASFDYAYLPRLHRQGYVAPNLGELESSVISPGGYVMRSKPGLYRNVLVLDFKSLYPSIIRTFCIDPYAFWAADQQKLSEIDVISGFNGARFARKNAILPQLIAELWEAREKAKLNHNQPLSQAIKIIMNSFYGVLGSTGCRFFDPRVCSSITLRGHEIIQRSRAWIVEQDYEVIYGDTDSLFIWLGNEDLQQNPNELGRRLAGSLNYWWQETLKKEFSIDSALEVEFETHYTHFLMPTIRGSSEGSKKRYAGIVNKNINGEIQETLVFKGLETVRTDWTELAKGFQKKLYFKIFKQEAYQDMIRLLVNKLLRGDLDNQLIYKKRLRRSLREYKKSNPPHVKAARFLHQSTGTLLGRGDTIEYLLTLNGPEPVECRQSQIDYQHYIDKQLKPIADSILFFVDDSFDDIVNQQMGLI